MNAYYSPPSESFGHWRYIRMGLIACAAIVVFVVMTFVVAPLVWITRKLWAWALSIT
jgi:NADH:ubiquinone oxidoreductase subunit H